MGVKLTWSEVVVRVVSVALPRLYTVVSSLLRTRSEERAKGTFLDRCASRATASSTR